MAAAVATAVRPVRRCRTTPPSTPTPPATLALSSPTLRTIAGGSAVPLAAKLSSGAAVHWQLATGAPGTLNADNGAAVTYRPPAGPLTAASLATVTASGDGASAALTLAVTPDPGPAGLYRMAWRTSSDFTMLFPVDLATDLSGNIYVELLVTGQSPSRRGAPQLVKIAPNGTLTTLIGLDPVTGAATWFGHARPVDADNRTYWAATPVVDRAGNIYFSTVPFGVPTGLGQQGTGGAVILKITPDGMLSALAGSEDAQIGALTDGTGSAARFLSPSIVGIDYDDNLYVLDNQGATVRKVTSAGVVTTLPALPTGLLADMKGNTYSFDTATQKLMRKAPDGTTSVENSVPYCADATPAAPLGCLGGQAGQVSQVGRIVPLGGASYALIQDGTVYRLVLRH